MQVPFADALVNKPMNRSHVKLRLLLLPFSQYSIRSLA